MKRMCAVFVLLAMHSAVPLAGASDWQSAEPHFPLRVAPDGKHLEDSSGRQFLVHGDTAWSLIAELRRKEVELYLADRRRRGFNTLLINLLEHQFASNAPANAYGELPFEGRAFGRLNERYFKRAALVLERAEKLGFAVLLAPAYLGANGGGQGWYLEAAEAGLETLRDYGTAIARRFIERRNIVWVHGGDFNAPDKAMVRAVVSGIRRVAPDSLHTVHSARDTATAEYWAGEKWLSLDSVYTYGDTRSAVLARTWRDQTMPVLMIEGLYEGEHGTNGETVRRQAYASMLSGAAGHIFGNNPIWHFSGPGLYPTKHGWQEALASQGAESMTHFRHLFESLAWWQVRPDAAIPGIRIDGPAYAASALDGAFSLVYVLDTERATLVLQPAGRPLEAQWFDPASGRLFAPRVRGGRADAAQKLLPPTVHNADGDRDWILMLRRAE